jgi:flagellar basal body-associated protein FliL
MQRLWYILKGIGITLLACAIVIAQAIGINSITISVAEHFHISQLVPLVFVFAIAVGTITGNSAYEDKNRYQRK